MRAETSARVGSQSEEARSPEKASCLGSGSPPILKWRGTLLPIPFPGEDMLQWLFRQVTQ